MPPLRPQPLLAEGTSTVTAALGVCLCARRAGPGTCVRPPALGSRPQCQGRREAGWGSEAGSAGCTASPAGALPSWLLQLELGAGQEGATPLSGPSGPPAQGLQTTRWDGQTGPV